MWLQRCVERWIWTTNSTTLYFQTNHDYACNRMMSNKSVPALRRGDGLDDSCIMNRHTCPLPSVMVWSVVKFYSRTSLIRTHNNQRSQMFWSLLSSLISKTCLQSSFNRTMWDRTRQTSFNNSSLSPDSTAALTHPFFWTVVHRIHGVNDWQDTIPAYTIRCYAR